MAWRFLISLLVALALYPLPAISRPVRPQTPPTGTNYEPDAVSPEEVFTQMGHSFRTDRARGQHLKFQFNFGEPQGGKWWIEVNDGAYTMGKGSVTRPDVTFACTGADWVRLSNGTLSGFKAFITGRLHVSGNQFAAHKLDEIFS
jgi:putative sterol carrier protein